MNIYVIRHGETEINVKRQINGRNDISLNEKGVEQAKSKQKEIEKLNIDFIICSPLERTKKTCEYINIQNKPVIYDERLMERDSRSMQYEPVTNIDMNLWYDSTKELIYKDTEGFKSVLTRIQEFLDEIKEKYLDKNILLVTHGDVCKAIYTYFNDEKIDFTKDYQKNCDIVKYEL